MLFKLVRVEMRWDGNKIINDKIVRIWKEAIVTYVWSIAFVPIKFYEAFTGGHKTFNSEHWKLFINQKDTGN